MVDKIIKKASPLRGEAPAIAGDEVEYIKRSNLIRRLCKRHLLLVQKEKAFMIKYPYKKSTI